MLSGRRVAVLLVVAVLALGGLLIIADWQEITQVIAAADARPLVPALAMTLVSFACISYSFSAVCRLLGIGMSRHRLAGIGYVTSALNHIVQSGGIAGYSVRYALMNRFGVQLNDVLAASILHFYVTSLAMQAMLPIGFAYLLFNAQLSPTASIAMMAVTGLVIVLFTVSTALVFGPRVRQPVLRLLERVGRRLTKRDVGSLLADFDEALTRGTAAMRRRPSRLVIIVCLVVVDWIASALTLGFCFQALGAPLPPGTLFTGFVIGIMAGVLSSLPAGIGVQDGSMAGVFALLGVGFGKAVLASLLFRVVFYVVPYAISLAFYWRLIPSEGKLKA